ncbi:MAG: alkaline phosphatase family protein [Bacillota bacterium]|nr:alkaline phosphatase family protein [Bacillota bacterium]
MVDSINSAGGKAYYVTPFEEPYPKTFNESCQLIKKYCGEPGRKYIYCYCNEPDYTMHLTGCYSDQSKRLLSTLEIIIESLTEELEDTLVLVTADHGHIASKAVCIKDYPKIMNCLKIKSLK